MALGMSLHIGLNSVDPAAYGGWDGQLAACEADAADMKKICAAGGLKTKSLITKKATSAAVLAAMASAAKKLKAGDLFVISYSGHGGQMPDTNGDEPDKKDETWVLYDRQVLDDELYQQWATFAAGVRIVVLSDSCHSGSVVKAQLEEAAGTETADTLDAVVNRGRFMPDDANRADNERRKELYDEVRDTTPREGEKALAARVLLLSGCQDNQTSQDGDRNGLFTGTLRSVWKDGAFTGGYRRLYTSTRAKMPPWQSPNYFVLGDSANAFRRERPFTI